MDWQENWKYNDGSMYNQTVNGMNYSRILFHKVQWNLSQNETSELHEEWREQIMQFIYSGCISGEFAVDYNGDSDWLYWEVMTVWNGQN
jgi:hypothetical protein